MTSPNRRRHPRFTATAFLNTPVILSPLPPFFGSIIKGLLIDLSTSGMAILIKESLPLETKLFLTLRFPDLTVMGTTVQIRHTSPRENKVLHGLEFLDLSIEMQERIERMSHDYIDCESRIQTKKIDVCTSSCAFFSMCTKPEKKDVTSDRSSHIELIFNRLDQTTTNL